MEHLEIDFDEEILDEVPTNMFCVSSEMHDKMHEDDAFDRYLEEELERQGCTPTEIALILA